MVIDMSTQRWLDVNNILYVTANGDENGYQKILNNVLARIGKHDGKEN